MRLVVRNQRDLLIGLLFIACAGAFSLLARDLPVGSATVMGPGYFPMALSAVLALLGLIILIGGLRVSGEPIGPIPWRSLGLLTSAVVFFGFAVQGLGLGPTLAVTLVLTALTRPNVEWRSTGAMIGAIVLFSWLVFLKGLGLPLPFIGPWLGN